MLRRILQMVSEILTDTCVACDLYVSSSGLTPNDGLVRDWLFAWGFLRTASHSEWRRPVLFLRNCKYPDNVILRTCWHGDWAVSLLAGYIALHNYLLIRRFLIKNKKRQCVSFVNFVQKMCSVEIAGVYVFCSDLWPTLDDISIKWNVWCFGSSCYSNTAFPF